MGSLPKIAYTIQEAMQMTSLSRTTLWAAVKKGKLKCIRVGRRVLFTLQALEEFLVQQQ